MALRVADGGSVGNGGKVEDSEGDAGEGQGKIHISHVSGQRVLAARSSASGRAGK